MTVAMAARGPAHRATTTRGHVLFLGDAGAGLPALKDAAEQAHLTMVQQSSLKAADLEVERKHPTAIVIDGKGSVAEQACLHFRYNPMLANVPIVGLAGEVTDIAFEEMFGWGADDMAPRGNADALGRRLRQIALAGDIPLAPRRGLAVVADDDRRRRILAARVLRNAGYGVTFALDADEAIRESQQAGVELVISASSLEPGEGEGIVARARRAGATANWVVAATPKDSARMKTLVGGLSQVAVFDAFGPPENLLFVANELGRRGIADARASARILYGTTVRFRAAGADVEDVGYSYNVSGGGLYVRTLAPLARGTDAWLELCPPRCDRRVRIEARVVWTRGFGPNDAATVPPGFGVQISGGSMGDLEKYARGYRAFAADVAA